MATTHHIFVIHSYRHDGGTQHDLIGMLRARQRFHIQDHSIPDVRLYQGPRLRAEIRKRIGLAKVVLMIARPAAGRSAHIKFEVAHADQLGKPIIAIRPPGTQNLSSLATSFAKAVVGWDVEEIVYQIRHPGRTPPQTAEAAEQDDIRDEMGGGIGSFIGAPPITSQSKDNRSPKEVLSSVRRVPSEGSEHGGIALPPVRDNRLFN